MKHRGFARCHCDSHWHRSSRLLVAQTPRGPYARIVIMRALDGHSVDWETGYIRHLEWHRQAKDAFGCTAIRSGINGTPAWIIYRTFGHTAAELSNPVSPAEDDGQPHQRSATRAIPRELVYEFLPGALARQWCADSDSASRYTTVN